MNTPLRYIIVDDNKLDQLTLLAKAKLFDRLINVAVCNNADEALEAIKTLNPDIAFLDVDMPGTNGIELLRMAKEEVPIAIFVTSHMEYALESYELAAFDFILKPVQTERFKAAIERVFDFWEMKQNAIAYTVQFEKETITIKEGHSQIQIPLNDIHYLEAMKDYTRIITTHKKYMTLMPLSSFIKQLPVNVFSRIHRSYAVKRDKITRMQTGELFIGAQCLPIGKTFRTETAQWKI
ncbi:MAG: LytTR family DNA-binding domain-containing protein [Ferruginibacter sp.]